MAQQSQEVDPGQDLPQVLMLYQYPPLRRTICWILTHKDRKLWRRRRGNVEKPSVKKRNGQGKRGSGRNDTVGIIMNRAHLLLRVRSQGPHLHIEDDIVLLHGMETVSIEDLIRHRRDETETMRGISKKETLAVVPIVDTTLRTVKGNGNETVDVGMTTLVVTDLVQDGHAIEIAVLKTLYSKFFGSAAFESSYTSHSIILHNNTSL